MTSAILNQYIKKHILQKEVIKWSDMQIDCSDGKYTFDIWYLMPMIFGLIMYKVSSELFMMMPGLIFTILIIIITFYDDKVNLNIETFFVITNIRAFKLVYNSETEIVTIKNFYPKDIETIFLKPYKNSKSDCGYIFFSKESINYFNKGDIDVCDGFMGVQNSTKVRLYLNELLNEKKK